MPNFLCAISLNLDIHVGNRNSGENSICKFFILKYKTEDSCVIKIRRVSRIHFKIISRVVSKSIACHFYIATAICGEIHVTNHTSVIVGLRYGEQRVFGIRAIVNFNFGNAIVYGVRQLNFILSVEIFIRAYLKQYPVLISGIVEIVMLNMTIHNDEFGLIGTVVLFVNIRSDRPSQRWQGNRHQKANHKNLTYVLHFSNHVKPPLVLIEA